MHVEQVRWANLNIVHVQWQLIVKTAASTVSLTLVFLLNAICNHLQVVTAPVDQISVGLQEMEVQLRW